MRKRALSFVTLLAVSLLFSCGQESKTPDSTQVDASSQSSTPSSSVCQHQYAETFTKEATIIESGVKRFECSLCGDAYEEIIYDLDEFAFENQTYQYDGHAHEARISGMIPYGTTVEYEDNSLTEVGEKEATANVFDKDHNLLVSKKALIRVVEFTGFPVISVDTGGEDIPDKENYVPMTLDVSNCADDYLKSGLTGGIRLRGNGTMTYDKKAFRIKLDSKANMLGLNDGAKAKSWVLIADYADQSMMRNATAYYMGNSLFNYSGNYCTDYTHVSLMLNGEYHGVYLLAEQQQANKNRINLTEAETDYEGNDIGFLLELDQYAKKEDYYFAIGSAWGDNVQGVNLPRKEYSIKTDCYASSQVDFIKNYLGNAYSAFIKAVKGEGLFVLDEENNLVDSPYGNAYEALDSFIDLESLLKMYVLHEMMKNVDVGFSSFYMWVDFSATSQYKRLTFGAPWDFDWSSGNVNESPYKTSSGAYNSTNFGHLNPWFYLLSQTDFFAAKIAKYYQVYLDSGIFDGALLQANYEADAFAEEFAHNYERWPTLGTIVPKYTPDDVKDFKTHRDAVDHLINWLCKRKVALDSIFAIKMDR